MHSSLLRLCIALALVAGLPGCAARTADNDADEAVAVSASGQPLRELPIGTHWRLAGSERESLKLDEAAQVTLRIEDGRLFGNSGCNQYSAGFTIDDAGMLTLEPVVSTKRGCMGAVGDVEKAYYEALDSAAWFQRDGEALLLRLQDGDSLRFVAATPEVM